MEQTGFGIPLVIKRYGKTVFEFLDFFLRVTIPFEFEIESDDNQDTTPKTTPKTTSKTTSEKILALIKANPSITREEMAEECGISIDGIKWQIKQLKGKIQFIGSRKGGHWEIIEKK